MLAESSTTDRPVVPPRARAAALAGAIVFPASYLAVDLVADAGERPLPDAPASEIYSYLVDHTSSTALTGVMQLISVAGLAVFVHSVRRIVGNEGRARWGHIAGFTAVAAMCLSVLSLFVMSATVTDMSVGTASAVQTFAFLTGGVAHVLALGSYVWLTREKHPARGIRIFGAIAAVPAFLSLTSLLFFYGNMFILFGRLLCMVWVVAAAIALVRAGIVERRAAA